jgi:hypothetical protein
VAVAPEVKETYSNVSSILNLLNIDAVDFTYMCAVDLKMANILAGLQSHSCSFPCLYCECPKHLFCDEKASKQGVMRTFGKIKEDASNFESKCKIYNAEASAKDYHSCVHSPLILADDRDMLISTIPPPELHLLLRVTNKMFNEFQKKCPHICEEWLSKIGLVQPKLHSGEFTGNMCHKLLHKVDVLQTIADKKNLDTIQKYFKAFSAFREVVEGCFGKVLKPNFDQSICSFRSCYMELDISVTTAAHIVFVHLVQFCRLKKSGLSIYSEQASEAVHKDFDNLWTSTEKLPLSHPNFDKHLLRCVVRYNSRHL